MSEVSLKRFHFALFDGGLTLKNLKLAFIGFWIQTLHLFETKWSHCSFVPTHLTFRVVGLYVSDYLMSKFMSVNLKWYNDVVVYLLCLQLEVWKNLKIKVILIDKIN